MTKHIFPSLTEMDNPRLYQKFNKLQTKNVRDFLDSYLKYIKWRPEGGDSVMDVGCGTGDITCQVLKPSLPGDIPGIIGSDVSEEMIRTARTTYKDQGVSFEVLDITGEVPERFTGKFDHVFSFFCLHWIENQQKAVGGFYSLLKPGGDGLFLFPARCEQFDGSYEELAKKSRWENYMYDVEKHFLPYRFERKPEETLRKILDTAGFGATRCDVQNCRYLFGSRSELRGFLESVNPFVARVPEKDRGSFMEETMRAFGSRSDDELSCNFTLFQVHVVK